MKRCPRCGNTVISGDKIQGPRDTHGDHVTILEFYCGRCDLLESARTDDPKYGEFYQRWTAPDEGDGNDASG